MILFLLLEQQISKSDEILKTGKFKGANCVRSFWRTVFLPKRRRFERHFDAFMRFCVTSKWKKNQGKLHSQLSLDGSWGSAHTSLCSVYLRSAWSYLGDWRGGGARRATVTRTRFCREKKRPCSAGPGAPVSPMLNLKEASNAEACRLNNARSFPRSDQATCVNEAFNVEKSTGGKQTFTMVLHEFYLKRRLVFFMTFFT